MAEHINLPKEPTGRPEEQLRQLYNYLYEMAKTLNINLNAIGDAALTDDEQALMNQLMTNHQTSQTDETTPPGYNYQEHQTLKSLIIKTADFVKTQIDTYRITLFGETEANGDFGSYRQKKGVKVDVTPDGVKQTFSFAEVVKGTKTFEINSKNYIKTGYLRTENSLPVYGVAIGKDIVTFEEDGRETYNDGNKVVELTADELSFYQGAKKLASYKGSEVNFYINNKAKVKINADGVTFLDGSTKLAELLSSALKFYYNGALRTQMDSDGVSFWKDSTKLAEMLATALKFYYNGTLRTQMDSNGVSFVDGNKKLAELLSTALKFYYNGTLRGQMDSNGISFYNGDTKLMDVKAGEITFYQGGNTALKVTSARIGFYNSGSEYMYIEGGKFYCNGDMQLGSGKSVIVGNWKFDAKGQTYYSGSTALIQLGRYEDKTSGTKAAFYVKDGSTNYPDAIVRVYSYGYGDVDFMFGTWGSSGPAFYPSAENYSVTGLLGTSDKKWWIAYIDTIYSNIINYNSLIQQSSRDIKHNIEEMPEIGERLDQLQPVTFVYDDDPEEKKRFGLIYEDTQPVMPEICTGDEGQKAINYVEMIPMLLKEIQSLRARVSELEGRI